MHVRYWEGKLRAEYERYLLSDYDCQWDMRKLQPKAINNLRQYSHPFECNQAVLFDPLWVRDPIELGAPSQEQEKKTVPKDEQLWLYLSPELVRVSGR